MASFNDILKNLYILEGPDAFLRPMKMGRSLGSTSFVEVPPEWTELKILREVVGVMLLMQWLRELVRDAESREPSRWKRLEID